MTRWKRGCRAYLKEEHVHNCTNDTQRTWVYFRYGRNWLNQERSRQQHPAQGIIRLNYAGQDRRRYVSVRHTAHSADVYLAGAWLELGMARDCPPVPLP